MTVVNGYAAAQDVADLNAGVSALATAMGIRVGANESAILNLEDITASVRGEIIWAHDYEKNDLGVVDGVGAMWRRATAAGIAAGKRIRALPGPYILDGTPAIAQGLLGLESPGRLEIECLTGNIVFKAPTKAAAGTIITSTASNVVTGSSTLFTTILENKDKLYTVGGTYIGTVQTVTNNTSIILTENAKVTINPGAAFIYTDTNRAIISAMGGADLYLNNVELDADKVTTNFSIKFEGAGNFECGRLIIRHKGARWLGSNGQLDIGIVDTFDIVGHGVAGGSSPGTDFGYCLGGRIGGVRNTNATKSGFNWSNILTTGLLHIGYVSNRWTHWETSRIPYPSQYAAVRIGNGSSNVLVDKVYGEGVCRVVRLTDTDNVWVLHADGKDTFGPFVLLNSKDQIARNSGVLLVTGTGPCRGNGLEALLDEDGESISNPNEEAMIIAEGVGWFLGKASLAADEYLKGLGTLYSRTSSDIITNRDSVLRGQDFNCFKGVAVGDFVFDDQERTLGRVAEVFAKVYWTDAKETISQLTATGADHATQTIRLDANAAFTTSVPTGTLSVALNNVNVTGQGTKFQTELKQNGILHNAAGAYVGRIATINSDTSITLATGGAKVAMVTEAFHYAGAYRQRRVDSYFFVDGLANCDIAGTAMTGTLLTAQAKAGDAIFNGSGQYVGEVLTVNSATSITLTATALRPITAGAFKLGRWRKVARGLEVSETATFTHVNLNDIHVQGAVAQHRVQEPECLRPFMAPTITKTRLQRLDATKRTGERWLVTDLNPMGWVYSNGLVWVKEIGALRSSGTITDYTHKYMDVAEYTRFSGVVTGTQTITLSDEGLPDGATYIFSTAGGTTGTVTFLSHLGATIATARGETVIGFRYDGSNGTWRILWRAAAATTAYPRLTSGSGTPEGVVIGNVGDLYTRTNGSAGLVLYVKESGASTNTGWVAYSSVAEPFALGTALLPSISFAGDPNTGMWSPAADTIAWSTGGVERMRTLADGKFGVGVTAPNALIQVAGLVNFDPTLFNTLLGQTAGAAITTGNFNVAVGYRALLTDLTGANSVAVGTSAMRFNSDADNNVAVGFDAARGNADYTNIGGVYVGYQAGFTAATGSNYNTFIGNNSGYGCTTGEKNTLLGQSSASASYNQVTTGSRNIAIGNDVAVASPTANDQLCIGNLIYGLNLTGTGTTISATGLIGIGTKAPTAKLHIWTGSSTGSVNAAADEFLIEGSATAGLSILTPDTTGVCNIYFGHNSDNDAGRIVYTHNGDTMGIFTNGTQALWIDSTQRFGVGVTPTQKLEVDGAIKSKTYTVAGLAALTGTVGTRAFVTDATSSTFASIVVGGGAIGVPVYHDGTNWCVG